MLVQIKNIDENNSDKTYAVAIPLVSNIIPNIIVPDGIVINEINGTVEFRGASTISDIDIGNIILDYIDKFRDSWLYQIF